MGKCLHMIFSTAGLEILSTSYAGAPREPSFQDEPLGHVRNIRVKISNHFMLLKKHMATTHQPITRKELLW